jgi:hypothetical protein
MSLENWFWGIYVLTIFFGMWANYDPAMPVFYRRGGLFLVLMILVGLLGYQTFGSVIKR